jgi:hypothetical protein
LVNEEKYEEFYYRHHGGWGYGGGSQLYAALDQEEVVYEDLCSFKKPGQDQVCLSAVYVTITKPDLPLNKVLFP